MPPPLPVESLLSNSPPPTHQPPSPPPHPPLSLGHPKTGFGSKNAAAGADCRVEEGRFKNVTGTFFNRPKKENSYFEFT